MMSRIGIPEALLLNEPQFCFGTKSKIGESWIGRVIEFDSKNDFVLGLDPGNGGIAL